MNSPKVAELIDDGADQLAEISVRLERIENAIASLSDAEARFKPIPLETRSNMDLRAIVRDVGDRRGAIVEPFTRPDHRQVRGSVA